MNSRLPAFVLGIVCGAWITLATILVCAAFLGHPFSNGVIAAAKGEYVATRVDLPDGSVEWHVTRTKPKGESK